MKKIVHPDDVLAGGALCHLRQNVADQVFTCGPTAFMKQQCKELLALGVPASKLHREVLGPEALDQLL